MNKRPILVGQAVLPYRAGACENEGKGVYVQPLIRNVAEPLFRLSGSKTLVLALGDGTLKRSERVASATNFRARPSRPSCLKQDLRPTQHGMSAREDDVFDYHDFPPPSAHRAATAALGLRDSTDQHRGSTSEVNDHSPCPSEGQTLRSGRQKQAGALVGTGQQRQSPSTSANSSASTATESLDRSPRGQKWAISHFL